MTYRFADIRLNVTTLTIRFSQWDGVDSQRDYECYNLDLGDIERLESALAIAKEQLIKQIAEARVERREKLVQQREQLEQEINRIDKELTHE